MPYSIFGVVLVSMQKTVLPGDQLGFSEEFVAGSSAFEQDGVIYASAAGSEHSDAAARSVGVAARKSLRPVKQGDVVYGLVDDLMDTVAIVRFQAAPQGSLSLVSGTDSAFLRVSELMPGYVEHIRDCLRVGDIIRARVLDVKPLGTYLTLKADDLGVIQAYCSRCRSEMASRQTFFLCPKCGSRESRKVIKQ